MINTLIKILSSQPLPLEKEKETQELIEALFKKNAIAYNREHMLDTNNIPDFFIDGIAIEVKIKGNAKQIYRQCVRYCNFKEVKSLILLTNRSMGWPQELNGKPCYIINLGKAWL